MAYAPVVVPGRQVNSGEATAAELINAALIAGKQSLKGVIPALRLQDPIVINIPTLTDGSVSRRRYSARTKVDERLLQSASEERIEALKGFRERRSASDNSTL